MSEKERLILYKPVCNRAVHPFTQRKTEQREQNLLIKLNDRGPFHHLSHKLEEIDSRKERSSTPVILFSTPTAH